jgi:hypothetical protein
MSENTRLLIFVISDFIRAPSRNCLSEYEFRSLHLPRIISYRQFSRSILAGICKRIIVISQNQHRNFMTLNETEAWWTFAVFWSCLFHSPFWCKSLVEPFYCTYIFTPHGSKTCQKIDITLSHPVTCLPSRHGMDTDLGNIGAAIWRWGVRALFLKMTKEHCAWHV